MDPKDAPNFELYRWAENFTHTQLARMVVDLALRVEALEWRGMDVHVSQHDVREVVLNQVKARFSR